MSVMTKTLLWLSLTCLVSGLVLVSPFVKVEIAASLYVLLPAGAILFGLFLISFVLQKEAAAYDAEQEKLAKLSDDLPPAKSHQANAAQSARPLTEAKAH
jgi:hypothetical protein